MSKMTHILVDTANTFFRARHVINGDADIKLGMAFHITLNSIKKAWQDFNGTHVVFCLEGRSWRKDFYEPYKKNRTVARQALTEAQAEEDALFWEAFDSLKTFLDEKTNCTVMRHGNLEADDLIAGWVQAHPDDEHVIISSDTDFYQLLASNVQQYNGVSDELHTLEGIFDKRGKLVLDKKTKEPKQIPDPEWILFEKCMRGDSTDNVFSAYPGVRKKGSKNKVGLLEAYADRNAKGFNWNNLMLQRWTDHNGEEHRVLDDYERNKVLVDLTAQPDEVKQQIATTIAEGKVSRKRPMVGAQFLKFCGKYDLNRLSEHSQQYAEFLGAGNPE